MAEPINPSSPTHSATPLAGKPPEKRKPTATNTTAAHPPKRPHSGFSSNSDETKDTASSEQETKQEADEDVEVEDIVLYQELEDYEIRNGVNPVEDYDHMKRFCFPYIHVGIGNEGGWEAKIRHLKFKFKNQSCAMAPDQMEEYLLWKKMFARVRPPDAGSRIS